MTYGECLVNLNYREKNNPRLKVVNYVISQGVLYKRVVDGTFLRCINNEQQKKLLKLYHLDVCGGHFSSTVTAFKILSNCFY